MDTAILIELERAELAARERRLAAEVEAARIVTEAEHQAREIAAAVPERIRREVVARRRRLRAAARREIGALRAATVNERRTAQASDRGIDRAADFIVGAVLGERHSDEGG